jgi:hypothetical protein
MTKVKWPIYEIKVPDSAVCDWLEELVKQYPGELVFTYAGDDTTLHFVREDDAIAFRLKFGL